jgi:membrane-bound serine protease (ClpP class)
MKRSAILTILLTCAVPATWIPAARAQAPLVHVIELDNQIISPVTQKYITDAIERSEADDAQCLVILLDTPGGLLESTRAIVKSMMNARVPVVVYVAPSGSRAGSAGVFITLAANIAAMAPSTNIGAAHPVTPGGGDFGPEPEPTPRSEPKDKDESTTPTTTDEKDSKEEAEKDTSPMAEKILNDTVAWIRTIARARGRNADWAEKAVRESVSITEEEALEQNVIDLIAVDLDDLLQELDGREVEIHGNTTTLATKNARVLRISMTAVQKFLAIITHPNVAYLLMMLGTLGLIFEFTHPGIGFPGIAGAVCLLLALYSFQVLPVNYVALALLALGLVLLIAEVKVVSYGLLALGGTVCLVLGSMMLFESDNPSLRVSLKIILPTVLTLAAITLLVLYRAVRAMGSPVATGDEGMIGEIGEATTDLAPEGFVFVHGETWRARSTVPVAKGQKVRIVRVQGLSIEVEPHNPY